MTIRVVRGAPTPDELAAVVTLLVARSRPVPPSPRDSSAWTDRALLVRAQLRPGPGAWRRSTPPR